VTSISEVRMEEALEKTAISADVAALTNFGDWSYAVTGVAIVAGLLVVSYLLYMVDVWATDRIDGLLLAHYGPELYERYTSALQEDPLDLEPEPQCTAEDEVIKAYLIAEEQQYRGQFLPSRRSDTNGQYSGEGQFSPLPRFSKKMTPEELSGYRAISSFSPTAEVLKLLQNLISSWKPLS